MSLHFNELGQTDIDFVVQLAASNKGSGIIEEPRGYFDVLTLNPAGQLTAGHPEVFINLESFPVRLLWATFALIPQWETTPVPLGADARLIQRVGARFGFHDTYYMASDFAALPLWVNQCVAASDAVTSSSSSIIFPRPVVLSARDSLRVEVALESVPLSARNVRVAFTGVGMISKTPYFFEANIDIADVNEHILNTSDFRNDGPEPVVLTSMTVDCSAEEESGAGIGDIRQVTINVRQIGNGTNADWWRGPTTTDVTLRRLPGVLAGVNTGTAIVHRFPGDGVLWEPGIGINVELMSQNLVADGLDVGVHLFGYISVT